MAAKGIDFGEKAEFSFGVPVFGRMHGLIGRFLHVYMRAGNSQLFI